jgi:hypothetical protein
MKCFDADIALSTYISHCTLAKLARHATSREDRWLLVAKAAAQHPIFFFNFKFCIVQFRLSVEPFPSKSPRSNSTMA